MKNYKMKIKKLTNFVHPDKLTELRKKGKEIKIKKEKTEEEILDESFYMYLLQSPLIY